MTESIAYILLRPFLDDVPSHQFCGVSEAGGSDMLEISSKWHDDLLRAKVKPPNPQPTVCVRPGPPLAPLKAAARIPVLWIKCFAPALEHVRPPASKLHQRAPSLAILSDPAATKRASKVALPTCCVPDRDQPFIERAPARWASSDR